jgi:hypothetical protein
MFTYRCPRCGKQHGTASFEGPFQSTCLRCRESITVTQDVLRKDERIAKEPRRLGQGTPTGQMMALADVPDISLPPDEAVMPLGPRSALEALAADAQPGGAKEKSRAARPAGAPAPLPQEAPAGEDEGDGEGTYGIKGGAAAPRPPVDVEARSKAQRQAARADKKQGGKTGAAPKPPAAPPEKPEVSDQPFQRKEEGKQAPQSLKTLLQNRKVQIGLGVVLLLVVIVVCAMVFRKKTPTTTRKAPPPASKPQPKTTPSTAPKTPPTVKAPPVVVLPEAKDRNLIVKISAGRLAAELAANPEQTNRLYDKVLLEVSGKYDKMEQKQSLVPPARPHLLFKTAGARIYCDTLQSPTPKKMWDQVAEGELTVRGVYSNGVLYRSELVVPFSPAADGKYKGKEIDLLGVVESVQLPESPDGFPTIVFEKETSPDRPLQAVCFFRRTEADRVKAVVPGETVMIRGKCAGRDMDNHVRLDNCQIVDLKAPRPPAPLVEVLAFIRQYEEDMHEAPLPEPGKEERAELPVSVTGLARELAADKDVVHRKYRNKIITVIGKPLKRKDGVLVLQSEDTDKSLKVHCVFTPRAFKDLEANTEYTIQGWCDGVLSKGTLWLHNCVSADPTGTRDDRRLTERFLPHKQGRSLTYDVSGFTPGGMLVTRQVHDEGLAGRTEIRTTHFGPLVGKSLFDPGEPEKWIASTRTRKSKLGKMAPPPVITHQRTRGEFVEVEEQVQGMNGRPVVGWKPLLKLNARAGDVWRWSLDKVNYEFTLLAFEEDHGRLAAVVVENVTQATVPPIETRYTLVRDLGLVRLVRELQPPGQGRRILEEQLLIEEPLGAPTEDAVQAGPQKLETAPKK